MLMQSFGSDFASLLNPGNNSGLNSSIYAVLTVAFVTSGLSYQFFPTQTLTGIFGNAAGKGLEDIYLWQLLGGGLATSVGPIAYTQRVSMLSPCLGCPPLSWMHSIQRLSECMQVPFLPCVCSGAPVTGMYCIEVAVHSCYIIHVHVYALLAILGMQTPYM